MSKEKLYDEFMNTFFKYIEQKHKYYLKVNFEDYCTFHLNKNIVLNLLNKIMDFVNKKSNYMETYKNVVYNNMLMLENWCSSEIHFDNQNFDIREIQTKLENKHRNLFSNIQSSFTAIENDVEMNDFFRKELNEYKKLLDS